MYLLTCPMDPAGHLPYMNSDFFQNTYKGENMTD